MPATDSEYEVLTLTTMPIPVDKPSESVGEQLAAAEANFANLQAARR